MVQTPWQERMFREHGHNLVCIDGTHNTTCYENTTLTTLVVCDRWGHGIPVAWMISNSGTEETITNFLNLVHKRSPTILPCIIMTDCDHAQINACCYIFFHAIILLCWWHVLHAWQQHFCIPAHPDLWKLLKKWIRIKDPAIFECTWQQIQRLATPSFLEYLHKMWMCDDIIKMWSATHRVGRSIFEESDTNMLIEA